jgi:hypothetical protein
METNATKIDYRRHILVGVRADGVLTIIEDWPHVPTQTDVQEAIHGARVPFANFALRTPTSVLPGKRGVEEKKLPPRFGPPGPTRRPQRTDFERLAHAKWMRGGSRILERS